MGCQGWVEIGSNLVFSICTHDPDTGVLTDADFAPTYRVYEDETGAAILTGIMTVLDGVNTTGFYTELIACTAANGFEHNRSYTVYIEATVDGDTGGISYGFVASDSLDEAVDGAYTLRESIRLINAALLGKSTGGNTNTLRFRDISDTMTRISATVSAFGDRTAIILDET